VERSEASGDHDLDGSILLAAALGEVRRGRLGGADARGLEAVGADA
jgi:hypothetical protein